MALEEMKQYEYGLNVDRLISLSALIAFVKLQNANIGYKKRIETDDQDYLDKSDEIYNLKGKSAFRNVGRRRGGNSRKPSKSAFRNIN